MKKKEAKKMIKWFIIKNILNIIIINYTIIIPNIPIGDKLDCAEGPQSNPSLPPK